MSTIASIAYSHQHMASQLHPPASGALVHGKVQIEVCICRGMLLHGTPTPCQWFERVIQQDMQCSTCSDSTEGKTHLCHGTSRRTQQFDATF